jgi:hypothetical protein
MAKTNPKHKPKHTQKKEHRSLKEISDHLFHTIGNFMRSQKGPGDLDKLREAYQTAAPLLINPPIPTIGVSDASQMLFPGVEKGFGLRGDQKWRPWMEPTYSGQLLDANRESWPFSCLSC